MEQSTSLPNQSHVLKIFWLSVFIDSFGNYCNVIIYHVPDGRTIGATRFPLELVVFSVPCPSGAEADQLGCDVSQAPLQPPGALLPQITVEKQQRPVTLLTVTPIPAALCKVIMCLTCVCCRGLGGLGSPPLKE